MKASILNFFEPGEQGHGIIMEAPGLPPIKCLITFPRSWMPSEVDEIRKPIVHIKSPYLRIPKIAGF